jgi:hypothetical protein
MFSFVLLHQLTDFFMFSAFLPQNGFGNWKLGYLLAFKHLHWLLAVCFGCEHRQSVVDGWVLP